MAWQAFQEVVWGWVGNEGIHIGQGIRFHPFSAYVVPWGVDSEQFFNFGGVPLGAYDFLYYIPISLVWLYCAVYLFSSPCAGGRGWSGRLSAQGGAGGREVLVQVGVGV